MVNLNDYKNLHAHCLYETKEIFGTKTATAQSYKTDITLLVPDSYTLS